MNHIPGRKAGNGRFAKLPVKVLESKAVTTLGHAPFRVLVLLAAQYSGFNNGALGLTAKQAAKSGIGSDKTLYQALRELEQRLLIRKTFPASRTPPRPAMWALTWLPLDDTKFCNKSARPTHDYQEWQPARKAA